MHSEGTPKFSNDAGAARIAIGVREFECIGAEPLDANFHGIVGRIAALATPPRRDPIS